MYQNNQKPSDHMARSSSVLLFHLWHSISDLALLWVCYLIKMDRFLILNDQLQLVLLVRIVLLVVNVRPPLLSREMWLPISEFVSSTRTSSMRTEGSFSAVFATRPSSTLGNIFDLLLSAILTIVDTSERFSSWLGSSHRQSYQYRGRRTWCQGPPGGSISCNGITWHGHKRVMYSVY